MQESRTQLLARVQNLKRDLQDWRGNLDNQVASYRTVRRSVSQVSFSYPLLESECRRAREHRSMFLLLTLTSACTPTFSTVLSRLVSSRLVSLSLSLVDHTGTRRAAQYTQHRGGAAAAGVPGPADNIETAARGNSESCRRCR